MTQPIDIKHSHYQPPHPLPAAILSYLVPGLGQLFQGRILKGVLFFVCLYVLFFYGLYLGEWRNVYIPSNQDDAQFQPMQKSSKYGDLLTQRARFLGQFWIGVAAWPALYQYFYPPRFNQPSWLGNLQRAPTEEEMNTILRNSDKTPDLGWIYTVIAGVLNILVIYDAYAGPAFGSNKPQPKPSHGAREGEE